MHDFSKMSRGRRVESCPLDRRAGKLANKCRDEVWMTSFAVDRPRHRSLTQPDEELRGSGSQLLGGCARNAPKRQCLFSNVASRRDIGFLLHWHDMGMSVIATAKQAYS
jgi:hypothetical protein